MYVTHSRKTTEKGNNYGSLSPKVPIMFPTNVAFCVGYRNVGCNLYLPQAGDGDNLASVVQK